MAWIIDWMAGPLVSFSFSLFFDQVSPAGPLHHLVPRDRMKKTMELQFFFQNKTNAPRRRVRMSFQVASSRCQLFFFFTREMEHVSVKATARILHFDLIFNFWFFPFFFFLQSIDTPVIGYWTAELRPS